MRYRHTEDESLRLSELGLGTYALAGVYGAKDPAEFERVAGRALDLGVTFFDTAPTYGNAEGILGRLLAGLRDKLVISTKVAAGIEEGFSCSFEAVVASCERSLKNLRTDYVDLYQIHFDDGKTPAEEVVRAMESLKASGKIRHCGIGHVSCDRAEAYLAAGGVATLMGELSAVAPRYHRKMLGLLTKYGAGYIGFSLTGRGLLTGAFDGPVSLEDGDLRNMDALFAGQRKQSALRIKARLAELGAALGATPAQMAIRWALAQRGVVTGLVGPSTVAHLEEDAAACDLLIPQEVELEVEKVVAAEEARLRDALRSEMSAILAQEVHDLDQAPQLVYVLEGLSELDLAPEEDLVRAFKQLLTVMHGGGDVDLLEDLRKQLAAYAGR